jgi:Zn finger protein HypA/HybF involved in hydrogenase expression
VVDSALRLEKAHIVDRTANGSSGKVNLLLACPSCHSTFDNVLKPKLYKAVNNAKVRKLPTSWVDPLDWRSAIQLNRTASYRAIPANTYCDICGYGDSRLFAKNMFSKDDHLMCCSNCHLHFDEKVRPLLHAALKKAGVCFLPTAWK